MVGFNQSLTLSVNVFGDSFKYLLNAHDFKIDNNTTTVGVKPKLVNDLVSH